MTKQRLQEKFEKEVVPVMVKEFGIKNKIAVPTITKIAINMGVGQAAKNAQGLENLKKDFATIAGQAPSIRNARVSIASFSLRAGMPVGLSVTLRSGKMYAFLDRLFSIVLPRLRDFRGISTKSFDKSGNYTLGFTEHTVFPEIDPTKSAAAHGLEITIVVAGSDAEKSKRLLELLGCPFIKEDTK
ncbi:MAG TPA: 50S ribosomal protein L5 [Alphaproteobacteria bacterium]|jgi:large subunit ribosomal protein L5|nr:50S ribosomal protein L5 [Alphaproteobacteria bacterium]